MSQSSEELLETAMREAAAQPARKQYTVTASHYETGCGVTMMILVTRVANPEEAKEKFVKAFHGGDYLVRGATVEEGFNRKNPVVDALLTDKLMTILEDPRGCDFSTYLHFNYA